MRPISFISLWFLFMFLFQISSLDLVFGQCLDDQRSLLLQLNNSLVHNPISSTTKLSQWDQNVDCCRWFGVECDTSGRVIGLDLDNETISDVGNSTSLFSFQYLERLNLAYNSFSDVPIPAGLRNLTNLARLNLSNAGFGGQIPVEIAEMRSLVMIDLSSQFQGEVPLNLLNPNLKSFVQNLEALQELYLDGVNISSQGDWWESLSSSLPNLRNLSLRHCGLTGPLSSSFSQLQSLSVLRLDSNNLSTTAPDVFANFRNLTILSLSFCSLQGAFPDSVFQVPTLQQLDLSNNMNITGNISGFSGSIRTLALSYTNFSGALPNSISNLSMLSMIDLSNSNFTGPIPSNIGSLPELVHLDFSYNSFTGYIPDFPMSEKLTYIDLSSNGLNGTLSSSQFERLSNLSLLNLAQNSLTGSIPLSLFNLSSLQILVLSNNRFTGQLNEFLTQNSALGTLDLSSNRLEGHIPDSFFNLERLNVLLLSFNLFNGTLRLENIQRLQNLTNLGLAYNNLTVISNSELLSFPQLTRLNLASCNLQRFPNLRNQTRLNNLDLSNNKISGDIPNWIWGIGPGSLTSLNLSSNSLVNLQTPYNIPSSLSVLDLHSNMLGGNLPVTPAAPIYLDYSSNNFQGAIPFDIGNNISFSLFFSVANNNIAGEIPISLCNATYLQVLDLSGNLLSGVIPNCLWNLPALGVMNLGNNNITGNIPDTFSASCGLQTLDLSRNNLEGKIPKSLANCKLLEVMNVGSNNIHDTFPCILKNSSSLRVLVLRSNRFYGDIKCPSVNESIVSWPHLQIIDIASNNFTGNLYPGCVSSWKGMVLDNSQQVTRNHLKFGILQLNNNLYYQDTLIVRLKGLELELLKILTVFTSIDFSDNKFQGTIPDTIGGLSSLYVLNFSRNSFAGEIPRSIGNLTQLGSLDLSSNHLTGEIPRELASNLTFLSFLNVSYNSLSGSIPTGNQFSTFSPESYEGNIGLCGYPLNRFCGSIVPTGTEPVASSSSNISFDWQYIVTGLGYGAGAALILAHLACNKKCKERFEAHQDRFLKFIYPGYGFSYIRYDGKDPAAEKTEDDMTDDDDDDEDEDDYFVKTDESSSGKYCVFCTKLDFQMKMTIHNPKCTCYYSPPTFSLSSPTSSASSSILITYENF